MSEPPGMYAKVQRCATQMNRIRKEIPEHFTDHSNGLRRGRCHEPVLSALNQRLSIAFSRFRRNHRELKPELSKLENELGQFPLPTGEGGPRQRAG